MCMCLCAPSWLLRTPYPGPWTELCAFIIMKPPPLIMNRHPMHLVWGREAFHETVLAGVASERGHIWDVIGWLGKRLTCRGRVCCKRGNKSDTLRCQSGMFAWFFKWNYSTHNTEGIIRVDWSSMGEVKRVAEAALGITRPSGPLASISVTRAIIKPLRFGVMAGFFCIII